MSKELRIAYLIHTIGPGAGAEKHLLFLLPELQKLGIKCSLFIITRREYKENLTDFYEKLVENNIPVIFIFKKSYLDFFWIAKEISRILKRKGYSILHSHLSNSDLIAVMVKRFFYRNLVLLSTIHGYTESETLKTARFRRGFRGIIYFYFTKMLIRYTNHQLAVSETIAELYHKAKLTEKKIPFVHHGIEINTTKHIEETQIDGNPMIISVGRLVEGKGHIYLFRAMPTIARKFPNIKLIIVGGGPLKQKLLDEIDALDIGRYIDFVGFTSPLTYIRQCKVMVIPSLFEAFGLVYVEAMAMKIPVVAFEAGAVVEIIDKNVNGLLVPPKDSAALAEGIIYLLDNSAERNRLAEAGYKKFKDYFSIERMAKETYQWYEKVL